MGNHVKNDPWVLKHKELKESDDSYKQFVKKNRSRTMYAVEQYMDKSTFVAIGALLVFLGFLAAGLQLWVTQTEVDYNVVRALLGREGAELQSDLFGRMALSLYLLMPAGVIIGLFLMYLGTKEYLGVRNLAYCTRMVEGFLTEQDPAEMKVPKRYDPSWL